MYNKGQLGQTLIEVLIALTVGVLILGALVIATIVSIRNAQFSQNQIQATKYAQEAVDLVRTIRNRNLTVDSTNPPLTTFQNMWSTDFASCNYIPENSCQNLSFLGFFKLDSTAPKMTRMNTITESSELLADNFKRFVFIEDNPETSDTEKKVTVIVRWADASGNHESNVQTILTKQ